MEHKIPDLFKGFEATYYIAMLVIPCFSI